MDIAFPDKRKITKKAIEKYVIDVVEEHIQNKRFTMNILNGTKTLSFTLTVNVNADRPAINGLEGAHA